MDFLSADDIVSLLCKKETFARSVMEKLKIRFGQKETIVSPTIGEKTNLSKDKIPSLPDSSTTAIEYNVECCIARVKSGCQCSRKHKDGSLFCGLHKDKTLKFGRMDEKYEMPKRKARKKKTTVKVDEKVEEKVDEKVDEKVEEKVDEKTDASMDCKDVDDLLVDVMLEQGIDTRHTKPAFQNSMFDTLNEVDEEDEEDEYEDI